MKVAHEIDTVEEALRGQLWSQDPNARVLVSTGFGGVINVAIISDLFDGKTPEQRHRMVRSLLAQSALPTRLRKRIDLSLMITQAEALDYFPKQSLKASQVYVTRRQKQYRIIPTGQVVLQGRATSVTYGYIVESKSSEPFGLYVSFPTIELIRLGLGIGEPLPEGRLLGFAMEKAQRFLEGDKADWQQKPYGFVYTFDSARGDTLPSLNDDGG